MRALRMLSGSLLWIVAALLLLLGVVLSVTVILLPLGVPLFLLGKKLMGAAMRLFLPKAAAHPVKTGKDSVKDLAGSLRDSAESVTGHKSLRKRTKRSWKKAKSAIA